MDACGAVLRPVRRIAEHEELPMSFDDDNRWLPDLGLQRA